MKKANIDSELKKMESKIQDDERKENLLIKGGMITFYIKRE